MFQTAVLSLCVLTDRDEVDIIIPAKVSWNFISGFSKDLSRTSRYVSSCSPELKPQVGMRTDLVLYPGSEKHGRTLAYSCSSFLRVRLRDLCPLPMGVAMGPFNPTRCFCRVQSHAS